MNHGANVPSLPQVYLFHVYIALANDLPMHPEEKVITSIIG